MNQELMSDEEELSSPDSPQLQSDSDSNCASASSVEEGPCQCRWLGCGLWLSEVKTLGKHIERDHCKPQADGLFYCNWESCKRSMRGFNARYKMTVHMRTHTKEKPYICEKCEKKFSRAENLKIHARSHTGEKPYVCLKPGCGKRYSNSSDRFKHTRTHTIDKPYPCKVEGCQKRYTDPSSLRKHVKTYKHFPPCKISTPVTPVLPPTPQAINTENNYHDRLITPNIDERGWWNHKDRQQHDNCQERFNALHLQASLRRNLQEYERAFLMRTSMDYNSWMQHLVPWQQPQEQPLDLSKPICGHQ